MELRLESVTAVAEDLRRVFGCFPTGVTAVCARADDDRAVGMAVSTFTPVSIGPPLVSVCVQTTSTTWPRLRACPRLGVSVLAETQGGIGRRLSLKEENRFEGVDWCSGPDSAIFIEGASAWLDCSIHAEVPAGDHVIALLEVRGTHAEWDAPPLVFHGSRFRQLSAV